MMISNPVLACIVLYECIEVPVTNDGMFVTLRSGKGGDGDKYKEIEEIDSSLKRRAMNVFEEMQREEMQYEEMIKKRPRIDSVCFSHKSLIIMKFYNNGIEI